MPRKLALTLLIFGYASCMEMRETVERMVMVRRTGSDLQPAATGYIYKKESDRPARLVTMAASEVADHFTKLYEPHAFPAPPTRPAGPFHDNDDTKHAAAQLKEDIKPVTEEEDAEEDGMADDQFRKIFHEYPSSDLTPPNFANFMHGVDDDAGHGLFGLNDEYSFTKGNYYGDDGHKGFGDDHHYGEADEGKYYTDQYESFTVSNKGSKDKSGDKADEHGSDTKRDDKYKGAIHGYEAKDSKSDEVDGYHRVYDKDEFKKKNGFHDINKDEGDVDKFGHQDEHYRSDAGGVAKGKSYESGHHGDRAGAVSDEHKRDEIGKKTAHTGTQGDHSFLRDGTKYGDKIGARRARSYEYHVKHKDH